MNDRGDSGAVDEHVAPLVNYRVPRSDFETALMAVANISRRLERDGRRAAMRAALNNRASWGQIKHWRANRRTVPQWAIDVLKEKSEQRIKLLTESIAPLKNN